MDTLNIYAYIVNAKSALQKRLQRLEDAWADADRVLSALPIEGFTTETELLENEELRIDLEKKNVWAAFAFAGDGETYEWVIPGQRHKGKIGEPFPAELLEHLGVVK